MTQALIDECQRQEESCLYTSVSLFEWLKALRIWRGVFVIAPIILGAVAAWPMLSEQPGLEWLTGISGLLAGITPAVYKALDFDTNLGVVSDHAHKFKILQDRFRQARLITALVSPDGFATQFDALMGRMDEARGASLTIPERFFRKAKEKIEAGHYDFKADSRPP